MDFSSQSAALGRLSLNSNNEAAVPSSLVVAALRGGALSGSQSLLQRLRSPVESQLLSQNPVQSLLGSRAEQLSSRITDDLIEQYLLQRRSRAGLLSDALALPSTSPPPALLASLSPTENVSSAIRNESMINEAYKRGRSDAMMSLLRDRRAIPDAKPPASIPSASMKRPEVAAIAPARRTQTEIRTQKEKNSRALEALGSEGLARRNANLPYFDASKLSDPDPIQVANRRTRGGVTEPFPEKLHRMLEDAEMNGMSDVVSFFPHGRAFAIKNPERFVREVMPKFFKQSRLSSFQRQLNLYGFTRVSSGPDTGGYYHELFLKGRPALAIHMRRVGVPSKGRPPRISNNGASPDFYSMPSVQQSYPE